MSFFDDIPEDVESFAVESWRSPDWSGPPANMVGGTAVLDLVLINTGDAAVALRGVSAYPTGVELWVAMRRRFRATSMRDTFGRLRFGIGFPNGRRAEGNRWTEDEGAPRLVPSGGGGGGLEHDWSYWLWPLPPEGTLQIACVWPAGGIEATRVGIERAPIRDAALRAIELWPDERPVE